LLAGARREKFSARILPMDDQMEHCKIAGPTIAEVFAAFLKEQEERLAPRSLAHYRQVIGLLRSSLDNYGYQNLSELERCLLDHFDNAENDAHSDFCKIFGPDKILPHLAEFLGYFMVRKVMCGYELKHAASVVTRKLARWLADAGYAGRDEAKREVSERSRIARDLPHTQVLAARLAEHLDRIGRKICDDEEPTEDHFSIREVKIKAIWLEGTGGLKLGPIALPAALARHCKAGWTIAGALVKRRGQWKLIEVWNVYP
jgi:hypothetical protein